MAPKQAQNDELRAMGSITPVGVILKLCNINYNFFYIHGSMHCNSILIRSNNIIRPRRRKVVAQIRPVPEAAVTVLCTPDDGCVGHPKHVEQFCGK